MPISGLLASWPSLPQDPCFCLICAPGRQELLFMYSGHHWQEDRSDHIVPTLLDCPQTAIKIATPVMIMILSVPVWVGLWLRQKRKGGEFVQSFKWVVAHLGY